MASTGERNGVSRSAEKKTFWARVVEEKDIMSKVPSRRRDKIYRGFFPYNILATASQPPSKRLPSMFTIHVKLLGT